MKHRDYVEQQRQDPEYLKAEAEGRPALELAEDIIRLRVERGWSQKELAKKLGTWQANVSRLEHGQANPTLETLRKLSEVFEVDLVVRLSAPQQVPEQEQAADWIFLSLPVAVSPASDTQTYCGVDIFGPDLQQPRISA